MTTTIQADDVLALLEAGPHHDHELAEWLRVPVDAMRAVLKALKAHGLVKRVGTEEKWALARYVAAVGRPDDPAINDAILAFLANGPKQNGAIGAQVHRSHAVVLERLHRLERAGLVKRVGANRYAAWALSTYDGPIQTPKYPPRVRKKKTPTKAAPRLQTPASTVEPSWWVTAPREGFTRRAADHEDRMREAKENRMVPLRTLQ